MHKCNIMKNITPITLPVAHRNIHKSKRYQKSHHNIDKWKIDHFSWPCSHSVPRSFVQRHVADPVSQGLQPRAQDRDIVLGGHSGHGDDVCHPRPGEHGGRLHIHLLHQETQPHGRGDSHSGGTQYILHRWVNYQHLSIWLTTKYIITIMLCRETKHLWIVKMLEHSV